MQRALVVGKAVATTKDESMRGRKLLVVQPLLAGGRAPDGFPLVTVDGVGAGVGETVLITSDGRGARTMLQSEKTPVRWTIIGIEDP